MCLPLYLGASFSVSFPLSSFHFCFPFLSPLWVPISCLGGFFFLNLAMEYGGSTISSSTIYVAKLQLTPMLYILGLKNAFGSKQKCNLDPKLYHLLPSGLKTGPLCYDGSFLKWSETTPSTPTTLSVPRSIYIYWMCPLIIIIVIIVCLRGWLLTLWTCFVRSPPPPAFCKLCLYISTELTGAVLTE